VSPTLTTEDGALPVVRPGGQGWVALMGRRSVSFVCSS
jgi:hypothetical protein